MWTPTGSLTTARWQHTATLLPDGRVLVAGGQSDTGPLASAELYDPATGAWTATGNLTAARIYHTATLLPDGRVLVVGGWNPSASLASAEVYDPATGAWTTTNNLQTVREEHEASLLTDGRVFVSGGGTYGSATASAELFDTGLGFNPAWRPVVGSITSPIILGRPVSAVGSGFRGHGLTEASGGGNRSSTTNFPLVQLRRLDNEQTRWLPVTAFDATSLRTTPLADFPPGKALVTVFVNGIPSVGTVVTVRPVSQLWLPIMVRP